MKRKLNSYKIEVEEASTFLYTVTIWDKNSDAVVVFPFQTTISRSDVQQLLFDLTDRQCEEYFKCDT